MWLLSFVSAFFVIQRGEGTLTPSGSLPIDCGGQQTFTCTVAGTAGWTITGLTGITAAGGTAQGIAAASARFTTTDTGLSTTSTITITGFNIGDNGGVVQCVDIGTTPTVEGMATIAVGPPQCGRVGMNVTGNDSCPCFTFTPLGNILPSTVVISYHLVQADPSSAGSLNCDYPIDPRMCKLNVSGGTYTVRATPQNNCDPPSSSCTETITVNVPANCTIPEELTCICSVASASVTPAILSGVVPSVVLILINIITAVAVFLVTRHFYKKSAKGGSSSRREELYEQVEGKKMHEDINMTDSPAYGPVK